MTVAAKRPHRLSPLLAPKSIALVGASQRPNKPGNDMVRELQTSGYEGRVYPVNPRYDQVEGLECVPSLSDLPEPVDLAVLAVGNEAVEGQLVQAVEAGARSAVIFGSLALPGDVEPPLLERVTAIASEAGMPLCGGNCMGFYNVEARVRAYPFHLPDKLEPGGVSFFSHSGSSLSALLWNERKIGFNLGISPGQELVTTVADYLDYALDLPSTTLVMMLLETVRDPEGFIAGLERARDQGVPIVVLKTGRTAESAAMALSHSGALVGDDQAYDAVFDRYGVSRVYSLDEMANTAVLMSQPRKAAHGGLAAIFDSGGERELLLDAAADEGVAFANVGEETTAKLEESLEYGLLPVNPLDAWGTGNDYAEIFETCWQALMDDPDTAIGLFVADLTDGFYLHEDFAEICKRVSARTDKPVGFMTNHAGSTHHRLARELTDSGVPVLEGTRPALAAVRHLLAYREFTARSTRRPGQTASREASSRWRARLSTGEPLNEAEGLELLGAYGVRTIGFQVADSLMTAVSAADALGYPVVLKTASPGIMHKSDVGGVCLGIDGPEALRDAYTEMSRRLGGSVVVAPMVRADFEVALGMVSDDQFGPLVVVAAGGVDVESVGDRVVGLPPLTPADAHRLIDRLRMRPLLDGTRGRAPADLEDLATCVSRLSTLAVDLGDLIAELDVNPVMLTPDGAVAVDALVIPSEPG